MSDRQSTSPDIAALWGLALQAVSCSQCGVAHLIPAGREGSTCLTCLSGILEPQPTLLRPEPPESILEFAFPPARVDNALKRWIGGMWLCPPELNPSVLLSRLTKTYIPMWLVDGSVVGTWTAQMGYDYQVASSQEEYSRGQWVTYERTETRIRWEPRVGQVERTYLNLVVPALEEHDRLWTGLGGFDLDAARDYAASSVADASVRVPSLLPDEAWPLARAKFDRLVAADCQVAAGAQHIEEVAIQAEYGDLHWTQLLLPVYASSYRDDEGRVIPVLINGQTGRVYGQIRVSQKRGWRWSRGLAIAALLCFLLTALLAVASAWLPSLIWGAVVLLVFSLVLGVAAPIPVIWAWQFNHRAN